MNHSEFRLSKHQSTLLRDLKELDEMLWSMYYGALKVLHTDNPERFALAAHCIRELIEKLPRYFDLKMEKDTLKNKVNELREEWNKCLRSTTCYDHENLDWKGNIDGALRKLLKVLEKFLKWVEEHRPRRREQMARLIRRMDPAGLPLPQPIEEIKVKELQLLDDFFHDIAHHRRSVGLDEFNERLYALERLLLSHFHPRAFDEFKEIDTIISQVEGEK